VSAQQNPHLITVKAGTGMSVLWLVVGSLLLLVGLLAAAAGAFSIHLITGSLFLVIGVMSFSKPYCGYDSATGTLYLYSPLGFQLRAYGSPKNERIYFDPTQAKVMRALPNGKQRKVSMVGVNRDELARLLAALPQHQA
jgi:hypothetical protein